MPGCRAVLNMSQEEYDKLASSMDNSAGVAKKTASVMQDNLKSKIEQLGGALESLAIKLSETVIPWLTDFVENLTGMIDKFTEMPKGAQKMITALGRHCHRRRAYYKGAGRGFQYPGHCVRRAC